MSDSPGKASVLNLIFSFVSLAITLIINVAIARLLGPNEKGALSVFQTTQAIILVTGWSVQQAIVRVVASQRPRWSTLNGTLSLLAFAQAVVLVAALSLAVQHPAARRLFLATLPNNSLVIMFLSVWGSLWFYFRSAVVLGLQESSLQAKVSFITSMLGNALMVTVLVALHSYGTLNAASVLVGSVAVNVGTGVVIWAASTRHLGRQATTATSTASLLRRIIGDSGPLFVRDILEWANYRVDVFFVNGLLGTREVGLYTVAVGLSMQVLQVPTALTGPVFAKIAQLGETPESLALVQYAYRITLVISLVVAVGVMIIVPLVLPLVYGNRYAGSVPMLMWLLPGTVFSGPTRMALAYLRGCGLLAAPIRAELVGLALTVTMNALLIPRYGPVGASIASSCSYTAVALYIGYYLVRTSGSSYGDLLILRREDLQRMLALFVRFLPRKRMSEAPTSWPANKE